MIDNPWLNDCNEYNPSTPTRQEKEEKFHLWKWNKQIILGYSITTEEEGIERKSVSDAISSVFAGRDRFKKEWERGKEFKYFAIVIEGNKKSILKEVRKNNARNKGSYTKKINLPGQVESIVNTYLHWSVKYNVPVFFCKDRVEAEKVTLTLLTAFNKYKLKGEK